MVKLELGKKYRTCDNKIYQVVEPNYHRQPEQKGWFVLQKVDNNGRLLGDWISRPENGIRKNAVTSNSYLFDLVEEIFELNLEVGKFYKTNGGNKVKILHKREAFATTPYIGILYNGAQETIVQFDEQGETADWTKIKLVGEWVEPVVLDGWIAYFRDTGTHSVVYNSLDEAKKNWGTRKNVVFIKISGKEEV